MSRRRPRHPTQLPELGQPTAAKRGSQGKIEAMRQRCARGEALFHAGDEPTFERVPRESVGGGKDPAVREALRARPKGVTLLKRKGNRKEKWRAILREKGKKPVYIGVFSTEGEAVAALERAREEGGK